MPTTNSGVQCVACQDTGRNSKGGLCSPCLHKGRQPLRNAVVGAITAVFVRYEAMGGLPTAEELHKAISWACQPRVTYAAGWRDKDGDMGMFEGPDPSLDAILHGSTPQDMPGKTAFIVRFVKTTYYEEPIVEPVARWHNGHWQRRKPG